jgi:hypothetical protein
MNKRFVLIDKVNENFEKLTNKQLIYTALTNSGMNQAEACKLIGTDQRNAPAMEKRIKANTGLDVKKMRKYDLTSSFFVNPALKSLKKLIKGEKVGTIKEVKDSTVLSAVKMVVDRHQPSVKEAVITHNSILTPQIIEPDYKDVTPKKHEKELKDDGQG